MKKIFFKALLLLMLTLTVTASFVACGDDDDDDKIEGYAITCYPDKDDSKSSTVYFEDQSGNKLNVIKKAGYNFLGYYTADGAMIFDSNGYQLPEIIIDNNNLVIYGHWEAIEYSIDFFINSEVFVSKTYTSHKLHYGDKLTSEMFPIPEISPSHSNMQFAGWTDETGKYRYTDESGNPVTNTYNKDYFTITDNKTVMYPSYEKKTFSVTVDFQHLDFENFVLDKYEPGAAFDPSVLNPYVYEKNGSCISGWSTASGYMAPLPETITDNITVYAIWKQYKDIDFIYDGSSHIQRIYEENDLSAILPEPEKPGFKYDGWYENELFSGKPIDNVYNRIAFSALADKYYTKWIPTEYTLTFETVNGTSYKSLVYNYGDTDILPYPEKLGYQFDGWQVTESGEAVSDIAPFYTIPSRLYGNYHLVPVWSAAKYGITLVTNGGEISSSSATVRYGESYTITVPTKYGYTFLGWYSSNDDNASAYTSADGQSISDWQSYEGATMYAKWKINTYTVIYHTGSNGTSVSPQSYEHGSTIEFPIDPTNSSGYLFAGWYDNIDYVNEYIEGTQVTSDMILYAKWIESTPIGTVEELLAIANDTTKNYHLTADINLRSETWTPIDKFSGIFNGNGYKIYNFMITESTDASYNYGFFRENYGTIKDVTFGDVSLRYTLNTWSDGASRIGIISGYNYGNIINCNLEKSTMQVIAALNAAGKYVAVYAGSISGWSSGSISFCHSEVDYLSCENMVGHTANSIATLGVMLSGLVGELREGGTISYSSYKGTISASYNNYKERYSGALYLSGIAGYSYALIENCTSEVNISFSNSSYNCYVYTGGIVAQNYAGTVSKCYSKTTVTGSTHLATYVGGIAGKNDSEIGNSYADANISVTASNDANLGGIVGLNYGNIRNSYATGTVTGSGGTTSVGGGVGWNSGVIVRCFSSVNVSDSNNRVDLFVSTVASDGTVTNCYYDTSSKVTVDGVLREPADVSGISGASANRLQNAQFLYDEMYWEDTVWTVSGDNFPTLAWMNN